MAEGVLFNIAESLTERLIEMLGSAALKEIELFFGVKNELRRLESTTSAIQSVLLDAEEKMAVNNQVKDWIGKLEDVFFEVDDLVDEFRAEGLRRRVMSGNKFTRQVRVFFSSSNQLVFQLKMGHRIKDIRETLDEIIENKEKFNFTERPVDTPISIGSSVRETYSFVHEEEVIGRDDDKSRIIQLLVESKFKENVSVLPIVGLGGLGKTTLAQYVFNDEKIKNHFELKMWVCVSDVFDVKLLVGKIIKSVTSHNPENNLDLEQLQTQLREILRGKRYLLVLDDVWNEDAENWRKLVMLLKDGAAGSRVLVTTRSGIVANITHTVMPYQLSGLSEDMSWSLFKKMTFREAQEPVEGSKIMALGMEVVEKCKGVPLAIRTIGTLLYTRVSQSQNPEEELLSFRDNELSKIDQNESDIIPTLKLSYKHLPSHLKHCFAYCCLFPKDYEIDVKKLILMWIAQGFIKCSNQNQCLEDVGYEYFTYLLWRSFFQEPRRDSFGNIRFCKMHDLMHDLAVFVARTSCLLINPNEKISPEKVRHVSIVGFDSEINNSSPILASLSQRKGIRTFLSSDESGNSSLSTFHDSLSKFKSLRVLSLVGMDIKVLPESVGESGHLRYLDLSFNDGMEMLPNSLTRLQNLQTLILYGCFALVRLPRNMKKLVNLRHLIIGHCNKLTHMPRGFGKLTCLHTLDGFVLAANNNASAAHIGELGSLNNLRGDLTIENLGHAKHIASESKAANLEEKRHLRSLFLRWVDVEETDDGNTTCIVENDEISLEGLQPHSNLKRLQVSGFMGVRFAGWLSSLNNLVELELWYCEKCEYLPGLDRLPSLKKLQFGNVEAEYMYADEEDDGHKDLDHIAAAVGNFNLFASTPFFPSLVELQIGCCPNLKGWMGWKRELDDGNHKDHHVFIRSFPRLSNLTVRCCPNLTSMPLFPYIENVSLDRSSSKPLQERIMMMKRNIPPSTSTTSTSVEAEGSGGNQLSLLKSIDIRESLDLVSLPDELGNISSLESISIWNCPSLTSLPEGIRNLPSLESISISNCPNLTSLPEGIGNLPSLKSIKIGDCLNLTSLPEGIGNISSLKSISIRDCPNLTSLPEGIGNLPSLKSIKIDDCLSCPVLPEEIENMSSLESIYIWNCPNLTSLPEGIGNLPSLESIKINGWPNLTSLPEEIGNISSLKSISIQHCPKLTSLPEGIGNLPSLKSINIYGCLNLTSLPEGIGNLPSLESLSIGNCPKLTSLPDNLSNLSSLKEIDIRGCPKLEERYQKLKFQQL